MLGEKRRLSSALSQWPWGGPKGLAWWVPPALDDHNWVGSAEWLLMPQLLYPNAEAEWPEEIASVAACFEMFVVLCY